MIAIVKCMKIYFEIGKIRTFSYTKKQYNINYNQSLHDKDDNIILIRSIFIQLFLVSFNGSYPTSICLSFTKKDFTRNIIMT